MWGSFAITIFEGKKQMPKTTVIWLVSMRQWCLLYVPYCTGTKRAWYDTAAGSRERWSCEQSWNKHEHTICEIRIPNATWTRHAHIWPIHQRPYTLTEKLGFHHQRNKYQRRYSLDLRRVGISGFLSWNFRRVTGEFKFGVIRFLLLLCSSIGNVYSYAKCLSSNALHTWTLLRLGTAVTDSQHFDSN